MRLLSLVWILLIIVGCTTQPTIKKNFVALTIGNQNYASKSTLQNALNDVKAVNETLEKLGFDIISDIDVTNKRFTQLLAKFKSKIDENTTTFFYFSGHGNIIKYNSNEVFFVMSDSDKNSLVSIYKLYNTLNKAKGKNNIICVDSCRSYIYDKDDSYSFYKGNNTLNISPIVKTSFDKNYPSKLPNETIISYATLVNNPASSFGKHDKKLSPYSYYLKKYLGYELNIIKIFQSIEDNIKEDFNGTQKSKSIPNITKDLILQKEGAMDFFDPL